MSKINAIVSSLLLTVSMAQGMELDNAPSTNIIYNVIGESDLHLTKLHGNKISNFDLFGLNNETGIALIEKFSESERNYFIASEIINIHTKKPQIFRMIFNEDSIKIDTKDITAYAKFKNNQDTYLNFIKNINDPIIKMIVSRTPVENINNNIITLPKTYGLIDALAHIKSHNLCLYTENKDGSLTEYHKYERNANHPWIHAIYDNGSYIPLTIAAIPSTVITPTNPEIVMYDMTSQKTYEKNSHDGPVPLDYLSEDEGMNIEIKEVKSTISAKPTAPEKKKRALEVHPELFAKDPTKNKKQKVNKNTQPVYLNAIVLEQNNNNVNTNMVPKKSEPIRLNKAPEPMAPNWISKPTTINEFSPLKSLLNDGWELKSNTDLKVKMQYKSDITLYRNGESKSFKIDYKDLRSLLPKQNQDAITSLIKYVNEAYSGNTGINAKINALAGSILSLALKSSPITLPSELAQKISGIPGAIQNATEKNIDTKDATQKEIRGIENYLKSAHLNVLAGITKKNTIPEPIKYLLPSEPQPLGSQEEIPTEEISFDAGDDDNIQDLLISKEDYSKREDPLSNASQKTGENNTLRIDLSDEDSSIIKIEGGIQQSPTLTIPKQKTKRALQKEVNALKKQKEKQDLENEANRLRLEIEQQKRDKEKHDLQIMQMQMQQSPMQPQPRMQQQQYPRYQMQQQMIQQKKTQQQLMQQQQQHQMMMQQQQHLLQQQNSQYPIQRQMLQRQQNSGHSSQYNSYDQSYDQYGQYSASYADGNSFGGLNMSSYNHQPYPNTNGYPINNSMHNGNNYVNTNSNNYSASNVMMDSFGIPTLKNGNHTGFSSKDGFFGMANNFSTDNNNNNHQQKLSDSAEKSASITEEDDDIGK